LSVTRNLGGIENMQRSKDLILAARTATRTAATPRRAMISSHDGAALVLAKNHNRFPWLTTLIVI
jgi:hypothetical protein